MVAIGLVSLPASTAPRSGRASIKPSVANMTSSPQVSRDRLIAFGSTCLAPWTSSAMEPADSKPTKEKPMNATIVRNGPNSQAAPCAVPAPLNRNENECVRLKNSSAIPIPSEAISSAVIETYSRPRRNLLPIMFAIEPKIRMPTREQAGLGLGQRVKTYRRPEELGREQRHGRRARWSAPSCRPNWRTSRSGRRIAGAPIDRRCPGTATWRPGRRTRP